MGTEEFSWSESFQRKLLAAYIREPQSCFHFIEPSYFTNPLHVDIARLTKEVYQKHNLNEVRLSRSTLAIIIRGYLGKKRRELWGSYKRVVTAIFEDDLRDKVVILDQALTFAKEQKFRQALIASEKFLNRRNFDAVIREIDKLKGFGVERDLGIEYWQGIDDPTRWGEDRHGLVKSFYLPRLDRNMGGGLGGGELGIILAGGKVGKTTLLGRFAGGALWQKKVVAIATGELSGAKYRKRLDAMVTGVPSWELTKAARAELGDGSKEMLRKLREYRERMHQARSQLKGQLWIKQWPTNKGKIGDIEEWMNRIEDQIGRKIDILFVDYLRVFKPNVRFEEQRLAIGEVALDLRGIAVERDIPVWTAQQSNRAALSKETIGPSDIAEDISAFWTLDFLLALCQTQGERGTEEEQKAGKPERARIYVASARDVASGYTINVSIKRDTFVVREAQQAKV